MFFLVVWTLLCFIHCFLLTKVSPLPLYESLFFSCICSLGISLLELACDLELPSGGTNWHCLRNGRLPNEFIKGTQTCVIVHNTSDDVPEHTLEVFLYRVAHLLKTSQTSRHKNAYYDVVHTHTDISPELVALLASMMNPDPSERLMVDQVLSHPSISWAGHRLTCRKVCNRASTMVKRIYLGMCYLVMLILNLFPTCKFDMERACECE